MKRFKLLSVAMLLCTSIYASADFITVHWFSPSTNIDGTPITDLASFNVYTGADTNFVKGVGIFTNLSDGIVTSPVTQDEYQAPIDVPEGTWITVTAVDNFGNESGFAQAVQYSSGAALDIPEIPTSIYLTKP